ncbi:MAG TPA: hypothetical protein VLA34_00275, partial [Candidatus Krumholzibacterium sp.]|nr:hypothetical protein [Candidatus Krumholzibacterium sp.]
MTAGRSHRRPGRRKNRTPSADGEIFLKRFPEPPKRGRTILTGYPAPYSIAMSNLGFHFLYSETAVSGRFRVERFFSDTSPVTLESASRLSSAFALLFSVSYEEDY